MGSSIHQVSPRKKANLMSDQGGGSDEAFYAVVKTHKHR